MTENDELVHFGVKGMRWGVRKAVERVKSSNLYAPGQKLSERAQKSPLYSPGQKVVDYLKGSNLNAPSRKLVEALRKKKDPFNKKLQEGEVVIEGGHGELLYFGVSKETRKLVKDVSNSKKFRDRVNKGEVTFEKYLNQRVKKDGKDPEAFVILKDTDGNVVWTSVQDAPN